MAGIVARINTPFGSGFPKIVLRCRDLPLVYRKQAAPAPF